MGEATAIDRQLPRVSIGALVAEGETIIEPRTVRYNTVVLAAGSRANDYGREG